MNRCRIEHALQQQPALDATLYPPCNFFRTVFICMILPSRNAALLIRRPEVYMHINCARLQNSRKKMQNASRAVAECSVWHTASQTHSVHEQHGGAHRTGHITIMHQ